MILNILINNKVDKGQSNIFTPTPTKAGNRKKTKNNKFLKLNELIPDTLETYKKGLIKFVPVIKDENELNYQKVHNIHIIILITR